LDYGEGKIQKKVQADLFRRDRQNRYLVKRSEDTEALEAVFDRKTLFVIYSMINRGILDRLNGVVKAGKEARVYWGISHGRDVAVKIFYTGTSTFRREAYITGDPRFAKFRKSGHELIYLWARKEFRNLRQARDAGVRVPSPYACEKNVLVMEFIGEAGNPASPLFESKDVNARDYRKVVSAMVDLFRKARLVHGDLSEFNIFKYRDEIVLFDFGSAVDVEHPRSREFLERDITNINRFFGKAGVRVLAERTILGRVGLA
jgi:RIO kinase 1